jgi:hypothetical protein
MEIIHFNPSTGNTVSVFVDIDMDDLIAIKDGYGDEIAESRHLSDDEVAFIVSGISPEEIERLFEAEGFTGAEFAFEPDFEEDGLTEEWA